MVKNEPELEWNLGEESEERQGRMEEGKNHFDGVTMHLVYLNDRKQLLTLS